MAYKRSAPASGNRSRVFIVDDHPVVRRGIVDLMRAHADLEVCGEASDMDEALNIMQGAQPDIAIVDLKLKEGSGLDLIRQMKIRFPQVRVLVSSMYEESLYAERAIRAGASGYVSKNEPPERLLEGVRKILAGKIFLSEEMMDEMLQRIPARQESAPPDPMDTLSDRELQVFELIGQGFSIKEIAGQLNLSPKTIESYRDGLKTKLNMESSRQLAKRAVEWSVQKG